MAKLVMCQEEEAFTEGLVVWDDNTVICEQEAIFLVKSKVGRAAFKDALSDFCDERVCFITFANIP